MILVTLSKVCRFDSFQPYFRNNRYRPSDIRSVFFRFCRVFRGILEAVLTSEYQMTALDLAVSTSVLVR